MPRIFGSASTGGGGTPGGSATQVQYNNAGAFGGITGATTDGTTLTLVAPVLGTPASATLTNATGLPPSTGLSTFVAPLKGGLGAALVPVIGDLLYADSTTSFARIAAPAAGQVLKSNGVGVAPSWSATPVLTSLALGGATIGSNALAVTGTANISGALTTTGFVYISGGADNRLLFGSSVDTSLSKVSAGVIGVGTGAQGSIAGTLSAGGYLLASGTAIPAGGTSGLGYKVSSTANFGVFFGSGAPSLSAARGSLYLRSDGSGATDRFYINTDGGTTWTAGTTVG